MAVDPWPEALPCFTAYDYAEGHAENRLRSSNDKGPAKVRARQSSAAAPLKLRCIVDRAQLVLFRAFYGETLIQGSLPFTIPDPTAAGTLLVRFAEDGFQLSRHSGVRFAIDLSLEILP